MEFLLRLFIGFEIFNWIGGTVRWIFGITLRKLLDKEQFTYMEYINGPKKGKDWFDDKGHGFVNVIISFITIGLIITLIVKFEN